jgi:hypothetical protein
MYWAVVGSAIGAATLVNVLDRVIARNRYVQPHQVHHEI